MNIQNSKTTFMKSRLMMFFMAIVFLMVNTQMHARESGRTLEQEYQKWIGWISELKNKPARRILHVGKSRTYETPADAAKDARDWDIIEIDRGEYKLSEVVWRANNLTIRSRGGRSHISNDGTIQNGKAIWVIQGNNVLIENFEFSGAAVPDNNGAGLRGEGKNLAVINCLFHHNQNGILVGGHEGSSIYITRSEFHHNGYQDGRAHNVYIGNVDALIFIQNFSHHAIIGHNLKSRAKNSYVLYNMLLDEVDGTASYALDLPNGGNSIVVGNVIQQGKDTDNNGIIAYALEGSPHANSTLLMINNTIINDRHNAVFLKNVKPYRQYLINNLFVGKGEISLYPVILKNNEGPISKDEYVNNLLLNESAWGKINVVDAALSPVIIDGVILDPMYEPDKTRQIIKRVKKGKLDVGALEYGTQ